MKKALADIVSAAGTVGTVILDVAELGLLSRSATEEQRKTAVKYMDGYKEQHGDVKTPEQWKKFYTAVKKRLLV